MIISHLNRKGTLFWDEKIIISLVVRENIGIKYEKEIHIHRRMNKTFDNKNTTSNKKEIVVVACRVIYCLTVSTTATANKKQRK